MTTAVLLAGLSLALAGCDPFLGHEASAELLRTRGTELAAIVQLVDACRPDSPDNFNRVFAEVGRNEGVTCTRGHPDALAQLEAMLQRHGLESASYIDVDPRSPAAEPLDHVSIVTAATGISVSGSTETIMWFANPQPDPHRVTYRRDNGAVLEEARALTGAPHHWFWQITNS